MCLPLKLTHGASSVGLECNAALGPSERFLHGNCNSEFDVLARILEETFKYILVHINTM